MMMTMMMAMMMMLAMRLNLVHELFCDMPPAKAKHQGRLLHRVALIMMLVMVMVMVMVTMMKR